MIGTSNVVCHTSNAWSWCNIVLQAAMILRRIHDVLNLDVSCLTSHLKVRCSTINRAAFSSSIHWFNPRLLPVLVSHWKTPFQDSIRMSTRLFLHHPSYRPTLVMLACLKTCLMLGCLPLVVVGHSSQTDPLDSDFGVASERNRPQMSEILKRAYLKIKKIYKTRCV